MGGHQRVVRGDPRECHIEYQRAPADVPARDGKLQGLQSDNFKLMYVWCATGRHSSSGNHLESILRDH